MMQYRSIFIFILLNCINFCYTQIATSKFRSSDIEIVPNIVVINSTSITDFTCINHQENDLPLEISLTKTIPSEQIKISSNILNKTAIHIQLESKNYVGIFHLLCFSKGEQSKGTRADVIVKAAPGILQLAEKCRVYDREYIKCIIRAPVIAPAIQNDYPAKFEFNEISHSPDILAYIRYVEFLKSESTNEYLVFKWKPRIDGEFPDGVRMHMTAILSHFGNSSYYFDMTPVFRIKPKFVLQALSSNEIQINLTSSSPAHCEKSIIPSLASNITQTWTVIQSDRNTMNNLLSNTVYRVCIKCRQELTDPDGAEECEQIKTLSKFAAIFTQKFYIIIISLLIVILIIGVVLGIYFWRRRSNPDYFPVPNKSEANQNGIPTNHYEPPEDQITTINITDIESRISTSESIDNMSQYSVTDKDGKYLPISNLTDVIDNCAPPKILFSPVN